MDIKRKKKKKHTHRLVYRVAAQLKILQEFISYSSRCWNDEAARIMPTVYTCGLPTKTETRSPILHPSKTSEVGVKGCRRDGNGLEQEAEAVNVNEKVARSGAPTLEVNSQVI